MKNIGKIDQILFERKKRYERNKGKMRKNTHKGSKNKYAFETKR